MGILQVMNGRQIATPRELPPGLTFMHLQFRYYPAGDGTHLPSTRGVADHATIIDDVRRPAKKRVRHFRFWSNVAWGVCMVTEPC